MTHTGGTGANYLDGATQLGYQNELLRRIQSYRPNLFFSTDTDGTMPPTLELGLELANSSVNSSFLGGNNNLGLSVWLLG
jgi:hypothetical protein